MISESAGMKESQAAMDNFFKTEALGTNVDVRCGSCKCGKCPVPGNIYSHCEEAELKIIQEGLKCDEVNKCWKTAYPYLYPKELLKGNRDIALRTMMVMERSLRKDPMWAFEYDHKS